MRVLPSKPKTSIAFVRKLTHKYGRNEPCGCGSKKKFKNCCINKVNSDKWIIRNVVSKSK